MLLEPPHSVLSNEKCLPIGTQGNRKPYFICFPSLHDHNPGMPIVPKPENSLFHIFCPVFQLFELTRYVPDHLFLDDQKWEYGKFYLITASMKCPLFSFQKDTLFPPQLQIRNSGIWGRNKQIIKKICTYKDCVTRIIQQKTLYF